MNSRISDMEQRMTGFDGFAKRCMRDWNVPGMAVGVVDRDSVLFSKGYGLRDPKAGLRVTDKTSFGICSCSKAFTSAAVGILVDDGKLGWDQPIQEYFPSFRAADPVLTSRLTMRDLLSHRSGVPGRDAAWIFSSASRAEMVRRIRHIRPNCDLRTTYQYNNLFYMLAGHIVEHLSRLTWEDFLRRRVFEPLKMGHSQFATDDASLSDDFAIGHTGPHAGRMTPFGGVAREHSMQAALGPVGPAGSIASNVVDMCRWLRMHLNGGLLPGGESPRIISEENLAQVHRPLIPIGPALIPSTELLDRIEAMGWVVQACRGMRMISHTGCFAGYKSIASFLPNEGLGVVMLTNSDNSALDQIIHMNIYDRLLGLERIDWNRRWKDFMKSAMPGPPEPTSRRKTTPSHPLRDYTGEYINPLCGGIGVSLHRGKLHIQFQGFDLETRHCHYDTFQTLAIAKGACVGGFRIRFDTNTDGQIAQMGIWFGFDPDETIFRKQ